MKKQYVTERCQPLTLESIAHLPLGRAYDVSFSGGRLADNQFSVSFGDNGMLKQVSLNSDPQPDESLAAAATLTERVGLRLAPHPWRLVARRSASRFSKSGRSW